MTKSTASKSSASKSSASKPIELKFKSIGQPVRRKEDERLIQGRGRFTDDFSEKGQTYAAMVRSPHPHARIVGIDSKAAAAMPGVLGIFTGADCLAEGFGPIPHNPVPKTKYDMKLAGPGGAAIFIGPHMLLPADKARHVGEAVAMVVAETPTQAADAAEAVSVEYDVLPFALDQIEAIGKDGVSVWDETIDNVFVDTTFGDIAATDKAFAKAAHVVTLDLFIPRATGVTMEPRAAFATHNAQTGESEVVVGGGGAVRQRDELSSVLGIDRDSLRVQTYDVGGNFGTRNRVYVEYGLVLWAARKLGRPVKWAASRYEAFISDYQGRDLHSHVELAIDKTGKFLAMRADNVSNAGARCVSLSPLGKGAGLITGSYDIPVATLRARAIFTNTPPTQAYRSSGRPEVNYAIERLVEKAARQIGMDAVKLRRKNLIQEKQMPYTNAVGAEYDSGEYEKNLDLALSMMDRKSFAKRKRDAAKRGKLLGFGLAHYVESSIGSPTERADMRVKPDGIIDVVIGTQPSGQGHETSFAQVASDLLNIPFEDVHIILGDTNIVKAGGGTHSGRSMRHAGTVISKGAVELIDKARKVMAHILRIDGDTIDWVDGQLVAEGTNHAFTLQELAKELANHKLPKDLADGICSSTTNEMHEPVFPNGCASCEVEVDPETGHFTITDYACVDDVGRCINPLIVHGQTHGAIVQGVSQAIWEICALDKDSGQPLAGSFMDYGIARASDMPSFKSEIVEVLSPTNPLGIKAGGEGGTTPALSVIINGLLDALSGLGVTDLQMPVTPHVVWKAIQEAKSGQQKSA
ncbi:MAG: xanthine dehydrogenase family protein molybdopterin-binding subunit [Beijerinckiaceae bacterium]|nr:xanthine dehydrogenase family protein molybdopterin-binding subunit [Beijerinckiaceae bacterium]